MFNDLSRLDSGNTLIEGIFEKSQSNQKIPTYNLKINEDKPGKLELVVNTDSSRWLIINDTYYPGWKAFVDEKGNNPVKEFIRLSKEKTLKLKEKMGIIRKL